MRCGCLFPLFCAPVPRNRSLYITAPHCGTTSQRSGVRVYAVLTTCSLHCIKAYQASQYFHYDASLADVPCCSQIMCHGDADRTGKIYAGTRTMHANLTPLALHAILAVARGRPEQQDSGGCGPAARRDRGGGASRGPRRRARFPTRLPICSASRGSCMPNTGAPLRKQNDSWLCWQGWSGCSPDARPPSPLCASRRRR